MIDKKRKMALAASLSAMASVQGGASIAKTLFAALGPAGVATLRTGLAGLLLTVIHRPQIRKFTREQWLCVLFYGFSTGAMNLIFYYGVQRIPLGLAVTVEYLGPLGLALIRSRKATDFLWAILAGLGVALIVPWSKQHTANGVDPLGLLLVLVAGVMWALYIVSGRRLSQKMKNSDATTCGLCVASLFILPFGILSGDLFHLTPKLAALGFCVAVLSSALPFSLDLFALKEIPSKVFSVLQSLQPAFAALSGLIFLRELLSPTQWLAIMFVIMASMGAALSHD
ncbi:MAG: EamA family transporter [Thermoguttaceae bacterium]|nr:EamA family transporter [Thermoguttaceae bacterium]MBQ1864727.1 EamA family transporter [Thermoguttaceae bacterium]MBQ3823026.1 EamA family transporter [Thermoguttaceae bacterium]MBQ5367576.1 EamA family transporter [Thermoguttaceae bacterium]